MYIGRKFFYSNFGKKKQKESDWRKYKTSSTYVKEAIEKYGIQYFSFEILQLFTTKGGVVAGEIETLWAAQVLTKKDENGVPIYWNRSIGNIKFIPKESASEETKLKLKKAWTPGRREAFSASQIGKSNPAKKPEVKAKMSAAHKGKILSPSHRRKLSERSYLKGKPSRSQSLDDWEVLLVFELHEEGLLQKDIVALTGYSQSGVSAILTKKYPRYIEIYNEYAKERETGSARCS